MFARPGVGGAEFRRRARVGEREPGALQPAPFVNDGLALRVAVIDRGSQEG